MNAIDILKDKAVGSRIPASRGANTKKAATEIAEADGEDSRQLRFIGRGLCRSTSFAPG